jgi:hypothetical protein
VGGGGGATGRVEGVSGKNYLGNVVFIIFSVGHC